VGPFGVPKVFLLVTAEDDARGGDEVGDVVEGGAVFLYDGPGHDVDI
jgi:hypothetical protein